MATHQLFPDEMIALQDELMNHPDVMTALSVTDDKSMGGILASLCTIFDIVIDGVFNEKEICGIAAQLTKELRQRRTLIVDYINQTQQKEKPQSLRP